MHLLKKKIFISVICCLLAAIVSADEGLWLFNKVPVELIKERYGFEITPKWIEHFQLSSAKLGGSASFVSADGLVVTNHHVGARAIQNLSSVETDYMKHGFYAPTREQELKCPDLEIEVLVGIEDVTSRIHSAVKPEMDTAAGDRAIDMEISAIEKENSEKTGLRCKVVKLYSGGMYHLYQYRIHKDVRLVFAPEQQLAFFGGDPDNYGYPRYCLDVAFFRVYEDGKPYRPKHYLRWSTRDTEDGDLVFCAGNPMVTSRQLTMSQLEFLRDVSYPDWLEGYDRDLKFFRIYKEKGAEEARQASRRIWGLENSQKCIRGQMRGLTNPQLMAAKSAHEKEIRDAVISDPELAARYGNAWNDMARAQKVHKEIYLPLNLIARGKAFQSTYYRIAQAIVRNASSKGKMSPSYKERILSMAPMDEDSEIQRLEKSLSILKKELGHLKEVQWVFEGRTAEETARELITGTELKDKDARKVYLESGPEKVCLSSDPFIKLVYLFKPLEDGFNEKYRKEVKAVETQSGALIARAVFELKGTSFPPDASSTLRLSFGQVKGYIEDDGSRIPHQTVYRGMFARSDKNRNRFPYNLPESFLKARNKIDMAQPINFVATCDSSGGNSGSPLVNTECEFIGILFDGNKQSLPSRFLYDAEQARSVMVHGLGILEALKSVYNARSLVKELIGK